jgi:hypothetical protein
VPVCIEYASTFRLKIHEWLQRRIPSQDKRWTRLRASLFCFFVLVVVVAAAAGVAVVVEKSYFDELMLLIVG